MPAPGSVQAPWGKCGGSVNITAGTVTLSGSGSSVVADTQLIGEGGGPAGNVTLQAQSLQVLGGAFISSSTIGSLARAGASTLPCPPSRLIARDQRTEPESAQGPSGWICGNITIHATDSLQVLGSAGASSTTFGPGAVAASSSPPAPLPSNFRTATSAGIATIAAETFATGQAGNAGPVTVQARSVQVLGGGAVISSSTFRRGQRRQRQCQRRITLNAEGSDLPGGIAAESGEMATERAGP